MQPTPSRTFPWRAALAACALCIAGSAHALSVFTCGPEWAALVRDLAPDAEVRSATHSRQDPHHIEARPSLIAALRKADLAVCTGASLEAGWLPMLQQRAGNPRVQDGAPGMLLASQHVRLIDPRPAGSPFDGDVHAEGNPHMHLDPQRVLQVARVLSERLQAIDPPRRDAYRARFAAWETEWRGRIAAWERKAAPLRGAKVVAQHTTYGYLWRWLGIEQVADLEPKPGVPPTPGHLQKVLELTRATPPRAVIVTSYQDPRGAEWLAQQLGGKVAVLQLPATATEEPPANTLAGLYDQLIDRLLAAGR
ncbi:MAG: zinc ABC transporter substrate-binding protein [Comamonadaceae bacterium]|nr:MAG: zinc ABC transporter substrate-binding protein [Comamonadaceae bacterium]